MTSFQCWKALYRMLEVNHSILLWALWTSIIITVLGYDHWYKNGMDVSSQQLSNLIVYFNSLVLLLVFWDSVSLHITDWFETLNLGWLACNVHKSTCLCLLIGEIKGHHAQLNWYSFKNWKQEEIWLYFMRCYYAFAGP